MTRRLAGALGAALLALLTACSDAYPHTGVQPPPPPDPYAMVVISFLPPGERPPVTVTDPLSVRQLDRRTQALATSVPFTGGPLPATCSADRGQVVELEFVLRPHLVPPDALAERVEARVGDCRLTTILRTGQPPLVVVGGQYLDDVLGYAHLAPVVA